jgi:tRNA(Ile)-lysidine synthetase-like protein
VDPIVTHIRQFLKDSLGALTGPPVVVAVSGGPDSLCLLHALAQLRPDGLALHAAHFDHGLRGADSRADAAFVEAAARAWGLPAALEQADVGAYAAAQRINLHQAARVLRYRFLAQVALATGAQAVAVAHHADDQAETVLMHLLRGAGPAGLRGMLPVSPWAAWAEGPPPHPPGPPLVRPLLGIPRAEIERYCGEHGLEPRQDATNDDPVYTRNRIRHELLPLLRSYNPQIVAALGRTAAISADEQALLQELLDQRWAELAQAAPGVVRLDLGRWRGLPAALQRAALRRAHDLLAPGATLPWEQIERARALVGRVDRRIELVGGVLLSSGYDQALLALGPPPAAAGPQLADGPQILPLPGELELGGGWAIQALWRAAEAPPALAPWQVDLDAAAVALPLAVRARRPGDRIDLGAGSKRLQDLFVDARIPRALRDAWPLVVSGDQIAWVPGLRAGARFRAQPAAEAALRICMAGPNVEYNTGTEPDRRTPTAPTGEDYGRSR